MATLNNKLVRNEVVDTDNNNNIPLLMLEEKKQDKA
jgi:hypothetical protein